MAAALVGGEGDGTAEFELADAVLDPFVPFEVLPESVFSPVRCSLGAAEAVPSFETGAKSAPVLGWFDALSTVADDADAAGGGLFEAHAPSVQASNVPQYFFIGLFLQRAFTAVASSSSQLASRSF